MGSLNFMKLATLNSLCVLGLLSLGSPASAQTTVTTIPQGYVTLTISAGTGTSPAVTYMYAPLHSESTASGVLAGQISTVGTNTISNTSGGWTASQLASTTSPTFIKITSGTAAGHTFHITANTDTVLTLDTQGLDLTTLGIVAGTDTYKIFAGDTLLSLFGTPSTNPVIGGTSPTGLVDQVFLQNGTGLFAYYYNTVNSKWQQGNNPVDKGSTYIRPDTAILYSRIGTTSFSMTFAGEVPTTQEKTVINTNGLTALAAYYPVATQTLGSLNLQNLPGWKSVGNTGITTSSQADQVFIVNGAGVFPYYYNATTLKWLQGNNPVDKSSTVIPLGSSMLIQRTGSTGVSILTLNIPYSL